MAKEVKTNAMRMLDRAKISYGVINYDSGVEFWFELENVKNERMESGK